MAKNSAGTKNPSRIRFVMVEAEIGDGDIGQITQAITNALRGPGPTTVVKRIAAPAQHVNGNGEDHAEPDVVEDAVDELDAVDVTPAAPRKKAQRRVAAKPQPIEIDVDSDPPLSSLGIFKSNHKRYLAIAAWLHDHRGIEVIDERHIYTCYRLLGWPTDIADFAQPLRELKHKQYFESPETGKYAINQIGLAKAKEATAA
jgi:hypothetical protein